MQNLKKFRKLNFILILLSLVAGLTGFKLIGDTKEGENFSNSTNRDYQKPKAASTSGEVTAIKACPQLFSQSTDKYLASAEKQSSEECFVAGCGGSL